MSPTPAGPVKAPTVTAYEKLKYNDVRARGSHNSYQRDEDIADQMVYWRLRHIELDIHTGRYNQSSPVGKRYYQRAEAGDWFVYHENYLIEDPSVQTLSDGLALLAGFHRAVPDHEVVTVALDVKNHFDAATGHTPAMLDALIERLLPGLVYKPADLLKDVASPTKLQEGANRWPLLKDVRGKFIFILTTGNLSTGSQLSEYIADGAMARVCFVAPEIDSVDQVTATQNENAVFFNTTIGNAPKIGPEVFKQGLVSRAYGANSREAFDRGKAAKSHLIGTDDVNTDADHWSRTHNVHGWPFQPIDLTVSAALAEPGLLIQVFVRSADVYGKEDNCAFKYNRVDSAKESGTVTYTCAVSVASSKVADKNGKAGLMARAGTGAGAVNFAVLRVADDNEPRVQVRSKAGGDTSQYKLDRAGTPGAGISGESWMWLRLTLSNQGKTAEGFTSYDGVYWKSLHKETFDKALDLRGIACSSHNTARDARYYFLPLEGGDRFASTARIGDPRHYVSGRAFDVPVSNP